MADSFLINRNFMFLWTGRVISQIGDKFYAIALAWWILEKTNSPGMMGLFMMASMLPGVVLGLFTGPFIDRWNRKSILVVSDLVRAISIFGITILSLFGILHLWQIVLATVIISVSSSFFDPSSSAIIPEIVEKEKLPKANALSQMVGGFCSVIGPLIGAAAVGFIGFTWVFFANAASYVLSAVFEKLITYSPSIQKNTANNYLGEIKSGLVFVFKQKKLIIIIFIIGIAHFFMGSLSVLFPFLADSLSGRGINNLSFLEMMVGTGLMTGAVLSNVRGKRALKSNNLFVFMASAGITFLLIGTAQSLGVKSVIPYMLFVFIFGISIVNASILWQSLLQLNAPKEISGRVFSVSTLIGNASLPISFGFFGFILSNTSFSCIMILSGVGLTVVSILLLIFFNKIVCGSQDKETITAG